MQIKTTVKVHLGLIHCTKIRKLDKIHWVRIYVGHPRQSDSATSQKFKNTCFSLSLLVETGLHLNSHTNLKHSIEGYSTVLLVTAEVLQYPVCLLREQLLNR